MSAISEFNILSPSQVPNPSQYFTPLPTAANPPTTALVDSPISPNPQPIPFNHGPTIPFSWPHPVITYAHTLDTLQFTLRPRAVNNRYFYMNGQNAHVGREQFEVYATRLPSHPSNTLPSDPSTTATAAAEDANPAQTTSPKPNQRQTLPDFTSLFQAIQQFPITPESATTPLTETQALPLSFKTPKHAHHPVFPTDKDASSIIAILHGSSFATGHPGVCHGGMLSTFIDSTMYEAFLESGRIGFTANLNINYRSPTPIHQLVWAVASVELTSPRKAAIRMALFSQDFETLYVDATALFVTPQEWVGVSPEQYGLAEMVNQEDDKQKPVIPLGKP